MTAAMMANNDKADDDGDHVNNVDMMANTATTMTITIKKGRLAMITIMISAAMATIIPMMKSDHRADGEGGCHRDDDDDIDIVGDGEMCNTNGGEMVAHMAMSLTTTKMTATIITTTRMRMAQWRSRR